MKRKGRGVYCVSKEHEAWPEEQAHLDRVLAVVAAQWAEAAQDSRAHAEAIQAAQEALREQNSLDMGGLFSAQGFGDLLELSQGTSALAAATAAGQDTDQALRSLAKMKDTPYFARIDFQFEGGNCRPIYIGRATLMEKDSFQIHVYDWRAPISSVFYQFGVGPAHYEAPSGRISGEVRLKRQYEIRHGALVYFFDADAQVQDHFLRELLARPASSAMKSIVETIQRDQDAVIRDMERDLLMVQGAAGSGKTSVALHRVAYLMYRGLQNNRLSAQHILILAPNATFARYIGQVLPDLGEEQVQTEVLESLVAGMLPHIRVQPRSAWIEGWLLCGDPGQREAMRAARAFKGSGAFVAMLDRLLYELPRRWIPYCDVDYDGQCVANGSLAKVSLCNSKRLVPLGVQLRMLERAIWRTIRERRPARMEKLLDFAGRYPHHAMERQAFARMLSIRESGVLLRQMRAFTRIDCLSLYRAAFADPAAFARLAQGLLPPEAMEGVRLATLRRLDDPALAYEDAAAVAYLEAKVYGHRAYAHIRQVVVDEAQDLDVLQATLLGLLFPGARFTILGDIHQSLTGQADASLYGQLPGILHRTNSALVTLDKSFRCTQEIWAFARHFLPPDTPGACFSRSGEPPRIHAAKDEPALDALLVQTAADCQAKGCKTVAMICKTGRDAKRLYERLQGKADLRLIDDEAVSDIRGTCVLSLYMAKGLEFDAVLLCDADATHYREAGDRSLLYIGCTRALHRLHVLYAGERSPLLPTEKEEA